MRPPRERANHRSSHERRGACAVTELRGGRLKRRQARDRGERSSPRCERLRLCSREGPRRQGRSAGQGELLALPRDRQGGRQPSQGSAAVPHPFQATIRSRISPNRSPKASSQAIPTCRSSCSARTTSRRSSNICKAFRRNSVSAPSRPWRQLRSRAPVSPRSRALQGRRAAAREPPNRIERLDHGLSDDR